MEDLIGEVKENLYEAAPGKQAYQESAPVNPKIVDVHTAGPFGDQVKTAGWVASWFMDADSEKRLLDFSCYMIILAGLVLYVTLHFLPSAYGRYASRAFGVLIPARLAWFLEDLPAVLIPILVFTRMEHIELHFANYVLLGLFIGSYIHRALIYPWFIRGGKPTPSVTFLVATVYNSLYSYLISRYLTRFCYYDPLWVLTPNFIAGLGMFVIGFAINVQSDAILRNLRSPLARGGYEPEIAKHGPETIGKVLDVDLGGADAAGPGAPMPTAHLSASRTPIGSTDTAGYKIPHGGMFEFVSCANFFGEIVQWFGFAMASWSLPGLAHALFTFSNLVPRALQHHQDYQLKFREDYPKNRAAVIPFLF